MKITSTFQFIRLNCQSTRRLAANDRNTATIIDTVVAAVAIVATSIIDTVVIVTIVAIVVILVIIVIVSRVVVSVLPDC